MAHYTEVGIAQVSLSQLVPLVLEEGQIGIVFPVASLGQEGEHGFIVSRMPIVDLTDPAATAEAISEVVAMVEQFRANPPEVTHE